MTNYHTIATLDVDEVAKILNCSTKTVLEKANLGELPGAKFGKSWIFKLVDVDHYLNAEIERQTQAKLTRYTQNTQARSYERPRSKSKHPPDLSPYRHLLKQ